MLPKSKRLNRELFVGLAASRRIVHSPSFILKTAPAAAPRLGVSVSKRVSKAAVIRNRLRRRVYAAVRPLFSGLPPKVYLLTAKPGAEALKGERLSEEVALLLKKSYNL